MKCFMAICMLIDNLFGINRILDGRDLYIVCILEISKKSILLTWKDMA